MRVLLISPSCHPATAYGGPSESVYRLARALAAAECEIRVLTTNANGAETLDVETGEELTVVPNLRIQYCRRSFGEASSVSLLRELRDRVRWADIVHLNAVYSFTTIPTLSVSAMLNKPLVWSPRGAFQAWAGTRKKTLKRGWDFICETVRPSRLGIHATSEQEQAAAEQRLRRIVSAVVPNIVEVPNRLDSRTPSKDLRLLYVGRLHPIKGLENLIESGRLFGARRKEWTLTIAGEGDPDYVAALRVHIDRCGISDRTQLLGSVTEEEKRALFQSSDVLVLPSYSENFGLVVPEALSHRLPVIASDRTPWAAVERVGCGISTPNDPESIADAVLRIGSMDLASMGDAGRRWVAETFASGPVAGQMRAFYERVQCLSR